MSELSFTAPQPSGDKVRPVAPDPVKAPAKKAAPKPDKYKPFNW
jgi:hypothetical protein